MSDAGESVPFGLIVIGNEVLDGRREDAHVRAVRGFLEERGHRLGWVLTLPDDSDVLVSQLRWAFRRPEPFFSCGGIGGTPDDLTRDCAAAAWGVQTVAHPEGLELLRSRFGGELTESRRRMVMFPEGATLIPNPVNNVPGFRIGDGFFVPGFPSMAHPMIRWAVDENYGAGTPQVHASVELPRAREADLVYVMERFILDHPGLGFSSLPRFVRDGPVVEFGVRGEARQVEAGIAELKRRLDADGIAWRESGGKEAKRDGAG